MTRVRFAPSPTGYFHVGGARTALFNWFIAKQNGGTLVLRIEDTDIERNRDEYIDGILSSMTWLGITWDEGPFFQSQRTDLYSKAVESLLKNGAAYYCDCQPDDVQLRNLQNFGYKEVAKGYDGFCRDRGLTSGVVRFRTPDQNTTVVVDIVRGEPKFDNSLIEDFVIRRSNGSFMFLLTNVVDDIDMRISHVVRAEEHLPNTPKAVLLWQALVALGFSDSPLPVFAHLPVIVNEKRQKLSKRRDKVAVEDYRTLGILPETMRTYLSTLGWTPPNEIISIDAMVEVFRLEDVNKSPSFFDNVKLISLNGQFIRALSIDDFIVQCEPFLVSKFGSFDAKLFREVASMVQKRVVMLSEVPDIVEFLFRPVELDNVAWFSENMVKVVKDFIGGVRDIDWTVDGIKNCLKSIGEIDGLKLSEVQVPIRLALTGKTVGLPLFESMVLLGRDVCLQRLNNVSRLN